MNKLTSNDIRQAIKELKKNEIKPIKGYYYSWQFGMTDKEFIQCFNTLANFGNQLESIQKNRN